MRDIPGCEFNCESLDLEAARLGAEWSPTIASYVVASINTPEKMCAFLVAFNAGFACAALRIHDVKAPDADAIIIRYWDDLISAMTSASPVPGTVSHDKKGKIVGARKRGLQ